MGKKLNDFLFADFYLTHSQIAIKNNKKQQQSHVAANIIDGKFIETEVQCYRANV